MVMSKVCTNFEGKKKNGHSKMGFFIQTCLKGERLRWTFQGLNWAFCFSKNCAYAKNQSVNATQDFERKLEDGTMKYK
jgi:hypothetical protein